MSTTPRLRHTTSTPKFLVTIGSDNTATRTAGVLAATSWAAKSSTTGEFLGSAHVVLELTEPSRFDPSGFILEHYVDGDLLDMNEPTHNTKAAPDNLHVWGKLFLLKYGA